MAPVSPAEDLFSLESIDALSAGALGFMPRLLVLTTLPHRRSKGHKFQRVNGRHSVRMSAPRRVGLPYGSYPRLLLSWLTTEAVRTKSTQIYLGATPNDLARKVGAVDHQWSPRYSAEARRAAHPPLVHASRVEDLIGHSTHAIWALGP